MLLMLLQAPLPDDITSQILGQFKAAQDAWLFGALAHASKLFGVLALIEGAWAMALLMMDKHDPRAWVGGLIKWVMVTGFFFALLQLGSQWIPAIIRSFQTIGQQTTGMNSLSPGDVFSQGINISGALLSSAGSNALFLKFGPSLALLFAAFSVFIAFLVITGEIVIALIEGMIAVSGGLLFLGFGASRWTRPFTGRFMEFCVACGAKIMVLYLVVSIGMELSAQWLEWANNVVPSVEGGVSSWTVAGAALLFMLLSWRIPRSFSNWLAGSVSLSAGEMGTSMAHTAMHMAYTAQMFTTATTKIAAAAGFSKGSSSTTASSTKTGASSTHGLGGSAPAAAPVSPPPAPGSNSSPVQPPTLVNGAPVIMPPPPIEPNGNKPQGGNS